MRTQALLRVLFASSLSVAIAACDDEPPADPLQSTDMAQTFDLSGPRSGTGTACQASRSDRGTCKGDFQTCILDGHNGFVGGYCTQDCATVDCDDDSACVRLAPGFDRCLVRCNTDDDCRAPDYVCAPYKACVPALGVYLGDQIRPGTADGEACTMAPDPRPKTAFDDNQQLTLVSGAQPSLAVDPVHHAVVATWANQYGNPVIGVRSSSDGGATFPDDPFFLPPDIRVATSQSQSDPVVAVDSQGTFYIVWLGANANDAAGVVYVARSTDGGASFPDVFIVAKSDDSLQDAQFARPWIAVGPDDSVYVSWAGVLTNGVSAQVLVSRSQDNGETWDPPVVATAENETQHARPQIAVSSDGTVYVSSLELVGEAFGDVRNKVVVQRLTADLVRDGGRIVMSGIMDSPPLDWPSLAVDGSKVYVAYPSGNVHGVWDIRVAASPDKGATVRPSVVVNTDASCATHFHPATAIGPDHRLHVVFYDNRFGEGNLFHAKATSGAESASFGFGANDLVNDASFPFTTEVGGTDWLGAHPALAATSNGLDVAWTDTRVNTTAQIYYTHKAVP
jgi:hypothetical protein